MSLSVVGIEVGAFIGSAPVAFADGLAGDGTGTGHLIAATDALGPIGFAATAPFGLNESW